jgi:c(7)-type cytochrome triheme protein
MLFCGLLLFIPAAESGGPWELPPSVSPDEYGNLLINRTSEKNRVKPALFSHWVHRRKHTCRVCHFELEFNMKVNTTEITEAANRAGKYCGAGGCHDGKAAFGHDSPNCEKCHNGNREYGKKRFSELSIFPKTKFGNRINWVKALKKGMITPLNYLAVKPSEGIGYDKELLLEAEWSGIPPAVFPHKAHIQWLDCNNCHPEIFNIKKKTTKHFSMNRILQGEFCGICHLKVAFPMNDCKRCHPGMEEEF